MMSSRPANRLIRATSPYLLQHAHQPVDWYPWGAEALARAAALDRPIMLSIGYAACHWCHVMAHESFDDDAIAALLNAQFVAIKVDREERPDLDALYMTAVQALIGSGGWPMTVFLLPDGTPFYGGTYYPPTDRGRMPGLPRVLHAVLEAYRERRDALRAGGADLVARIQAVMTPAEPAPLNRALLTIALDGLANQFDDALGGFGGAPKFPQPMTLEFLARAVARGADARAATMLFVTLQRMADGGIHDQLGGGFHRYSVDERWLVPHFEKMLYDNALLARAYCTGYRLGGDERLAAVAHGILHYLEREMRHPAGGFFSTQDADSLPAPDAPHAEEGAFFAWRLAELEAVLGADAPLAAAAFGVSAAGNFEHGTSVLHCARDHASLAASHGLGAAQVAERLAQARARLFAAREHRPRPERDEKILTAWNGLAIRAFADAARLLDTPRYAAVAAAAADFVLTALRAPDGRLLRHWRDGVPGATPGFLEDAMNLADGLLALYAATFDGQWLAHARSIADQAIGQFFDVASGAFFDTGAGHERLVVRPREVSDNATPSGSSTAAEVLLTLAAFTGAAQYRELAEAVLVCNAAMMARFPLGFGRSLAATELALARTAEVVVVGDPADPATRALLAAAAAEPWPPCVVIAASDPATAALDLPATRGRGLLAGRPTAYVCEHGTCRLPVTDPAALRAELAALRS
jgi:uncharacterized protein YyaL (SSP411 family)